jgi:hypothetical protein
MAYCSKIIVLGASAWLALGSIMGCNAVLGIEEARLSESASGAGAGGAGVVSTVTPSALKHTGLDTCVASKTDSAACSTCIRNACGPQKESACQQSYQCRGAMDAYSGCLGASCSVAGCTDEEFFTPNSPVDRCYGKCEHECAASPIYSACQLYCACMGANCGEKLSAQALDGGVSTPVFTSMADCQTQCESWAPAVVTCRRTHCEIAELYPMEAHCDHATGIGFCGTAVPLVTSCRDKSLNSFACTQDQDCCSNHCDAKGTRTCTPP